MTFSINLSGPVFVVLSCLSLVSYHVFDGAFLPSMAVNILNIPALLSIAVQSLAIYSYVSDDALIRTIVEKDKFNAKPYRMYSFFVYLAVYSTLAYVQELYYTSVVWGLNAMCVLVTFEALKQRVRLFELLKESESKEIL